MYHPPTSQITFFPTPVKRHEEFLTHLSTDHSSFTKGKAVPITGLEWPRRFQEVKAPRFRDNGTGWW
jgi:hypothetical protein